MHGTRVLSFQGALLRRGLILYFRRDGGVEKSLRLSAELFEAARTTEIIVLPIVFE
jgi:hypothetical protein